MPNILFVCSANRFRSVIAAECFRSLLAQKDVPGDWEVGSAGIWAREGAAPLKEATHFASSQHLDIGSVRSREINRDMVMAADLVIVMTEGQREAIECDFPVSGGKVIQLSEVCVGQSYDIPDPVISADEDPQEIGNEICTLISTGFYNILKKVNAVPAGTLEPLVISTENNTENNNEELIEEEDTPAKKQKPKRWIFWLLLVLVLLVGGGYLLWTNPFFGKPLPQFTGESIQTFTPLPGINTAIQGTSLPGTPQSPANGREKQGEIFPVLVGNEKAVCGQTEPMIILALGIDEVEQADVIRLVRIDFVERRILILSIPRDFWVPIPGLAEYNISQFRINAAYGYGEYFNGPGQGVVKFSETIYQNYGVTFDHYVALHFGAFEQLVDAVGGVDIYLEAPIGAYGSPGYHHFDGASALEFSRERDADLDRYRIMRQSEIIKGLYQKLIQPENLSELPSLGKQFIKDKSVVTDFTLQDVYTFTCFAQEINKDSLVFMDIPVDMYTPTITNFGRHIKIPNPEATNYIQDLILNGNY
jgi:LCP family protein required for cell wall assembly